MRKKNARLASMWGIYTNGYMNQTKYNCRYDTIFGLLITDYIWLHLRRLILKTM